MPIGDYSSSYNFTFTDGTGATTTTSSTTQIGNLSYENAQDTIGAFINNPLNFKPQTIPDSNANPTLVPPNENGQTGPQPYGSTEQKMIKQYYSDQVINSLRNTPNLTQDQM